MTVVYGIQGTERERGRQRESRGDRESGRETDIEGKRKRRRWRERREG